MAIAPGGAAAWRRRATTPVGITGRGGRWLAVASPDRRIHRYARSLSRTALQRVRHVPAVRAAVSVRRGAQSARRGVGLVDARVPARRRLRGAAAAAQRRRHDHDRRGARRPVLLRRRRRRAAQPGVGGRRPVAARRRRRLLYRFGRGYPVGLGCNGSTAAQHGGCRMARCAGPRAGQLRRAGARGRSWPSSANTAPRASPRTGSSSSGRWCPTIRSSRARCATGRSSTTACR